MGPGKLLRSKAVRAALVVIAGVDAFLFALPAHPALAVDCSTAIHYNTVTYTANSNNTKTHWGTKAATGIWVPSVAQNPVCGRASSIMAWDDSTGNQVEIGWFEDPQVTAPQCHYPAGDTQPRRLVTYTMYGTNYCPVAGTPPVLSPTSGYEPMNVHETAPGSGCSVTSATGSWAWVDNGSQIAAVSGLPLCNAISITNGERHSLNGSDNAHSDFQGLQWYGASGSFNAWTDNQTCHDVDPGYDPVFYSGVPQHSSVNAASPDLVTVSTFC